MKGSSPFPGKSTRRPSHGISVYVRSTALAAPCPPGTRPTRLRLRPRSRRHEAPCSSGKARPEFPSKSSQHLGVLREGVRVERRHDTPAPEVPHADDHIAHAQAVSGPRALGSPSTPPPTMLGLSRRPSYPNAAIAPSVATSRGSTSNRLAESSQKSRAPGPHPPPRFGLNPGHAVPPAGRRRRRGWRDERGAEDASSRLRHDRGIRDVHHAVSLDAEPIDSSAV